MNPLTNIEHRSFAKAATERLQASPYLVLRRISCECKDGVLVLQGRVFSFHEKQVAQEVVSSIEGMIQVVNQIEVD
jgi:osmotically-inducible protein OsmY